MSTRSSTTRSGTIYKSDSLAEISTPEQTMAEPTGDQRDEPARQADPKSNTAAGLMPLVQEMLRDQRSREAERDEERRERDEERRLREAKVAERERVRDEERRAEAAERE
jgi:hypothetical protein